MLHSGCVKLHQKFRDFVGLPMGLLREESPKNRMNTGYFVFAKFMVEKI